jgi:hypothetical protein
MKRILITVAFGLWALVQSIAATADQHALGIDIMTMNQYLGADLLPLADPNQDVYDFNETAIALLEKVAATDFPSRVIKLAEIIAKRHPDVVGLQEVFEFSCLDLDFPPPGEGCDNPRIRNAFNDHLSLTLDAIENQDASYEDVAIVLNFSTLGISLLPNLPGIPFNIDGYNGLVNIVDRDVILVRSDLPGSADPIDFSCPSPSLDGCNYNNFVSFTLPLPDDLGTTIEFPLKRGFVGVDITFDDANYRIINTHLEVRQPDVKNPLSFNVQASQAEELIKALKSTPSHKQLVIIGDINSSPDDPIIVISDPLQGFPDEEIIPPISNLWTRDTSTRGRCSRVTDQAILVARTRIY